MYYAESTAKCGAYGITHPAPDPDCQCGFWIPACDDSRLGDFRADYVELEVEIGGRVLNCGRDQNLKAPRGYRAEWQRILSVTLSSRCGQSTGRNGTCAGQARWLCAEPGHESRKLISACIVHMRRPSHVIATPVSWLRRELRTEIRPAFITDKLPPEESARLGALDAVAREQYPVLEDPGSCHDAAESELR